MKKEFFPHLLTAPFPWCKIEERVRAKRFPQINFEDQQEETIMQNIPKMIGGIVAVSRVCFLERISVNRRQAGVVATE